MYIIAYLCGDSYCQSIIAVYITDVKVAMLVNKNKKTKLLFHVNSVKNSFIVLSISMATFVMWLKKERSILCVRVLSSSEASFRLSQQNTGSLIMCA